MEPISSVGLQSALATQAAASNPASDAASIEDQFIEQAASTVFSLVLQIIQGEVGKGQA